MDDSAGNHQLVGGGEFLLDAPRDLEELLLRQDVGICPDLEGADARSQVLDAVEPLPGQRLRECVDPHAQGQVELHRSVLDEEVVVAAAPVGDRRARLGPWQAGEDAAVDDGIPIGAWGRCRVQPQPGGGLGGHRDEADCIAGTELAELPALSGHDRRRADETAQGGPVGAEQDGHVAGVVDGADGVRGVVDVGRVQARLAAVRARPPRPGADEAHTGARRVEVHLPVRGVEVADVVVGEELGGGVRAFDRADVPLAAEGRAPVEGHDGGLRALLAAVQDVARAQGAAAVSAEPAEGEGGRAAQELRYVQAAGEQHVGAQAVLVG